MKGHWDRRSRSPRTCPDSHGPYFAKGMCKKCYQRSYDKAKNETPERKFSLWKRHLKFRYGLDPVSWLRILERQHYVCAICKKSFTGRVAVVDHDHETGRIRGLLHHQCNARLGWAEIYHIDKYLAKTR